MGTTSNTTTTTSITTTTINSTTTTTTNTMTTVNLPTLTGTPLSTPTTQPTTTSNTTPMLPITLLETLTPNKPPVSQPVLIVQEPTPSSTHTTPHTRVGMLPHNNRLLLLSTTKGETHSISTISVG